MPGYFSIPDVYPKYTVGMLTPKTATTTAVTGGKVLPKAGAIGISGQPIRGAATGAFDINPQPQAGQGAYGAVPGPIAYPTTPYAEATRIYPGLANLTPQAGEEIRSQIAGEFTPMEENALWDLANRFGVASGMPGAQLWSNKFFGNRIEEGMKRRNLGVQNYNALLAELSKMGVDPALAAEIAARNANMAAAPNPADAAAELERKYLNAAMNPAGGTLNPSGISPGSYGGNLVASGALNPPASWYRSPAAGTVAGTAPVMPTGRPGTAVTSSRTEQDIIDEYLDEIAPVTWPSLETPATPMYQDEYDWLWNQATPTETYNPFPNPDEFTATPMYEDEYDWLWNQGEADPWSIYE